MLPHINIFTVILDAGANLNFKFPFKVAPTQAELVEARVSQDAKAKVKEEVQHKTTILVNTCRFANTRSCGLGKEEFGQLKYLLSKGCNFDVLDSDGHDGLHYAIKNNDTLLVDLIAKSLDKHALIVDLKDSEGDTAVHHCVQTSEFGSFENTQILEALHKMGFSLNEKNNHGVTPFDLSLGQSFRPYGKQADGALWCLRD